MPVTEPTEAIPELLLLQIPPVIELLKVVVPPTHTLAVPEIGTETIIARMVLFT